MVALLVLGVLSVIAGVPVFICLALYNGKVRAERRLASEKRQRINEKKQYAFEESKRGWDKIVLGLMRNPTSPQLLESAYCFIQAHSEFRNCGYAMALDLVSTSRGSNQNKIFALKVGRLRYSQYRKNHAPSVYDEAAIENDIKARC